MKHVTFGLLLAVGDGYACSLVELMAAPAGDLWTPSASKNAQQKIASAPGNLWLKEKRKHIRDEEGNKH